jgi:hypothetical protein
MYVPGNVPDNPGQIPGFLNRELAEISRSTQAVLPLTAAQIADPSPAMLANVDAVYRLNVSPYTRYTSNGTALISGASGAGDLLAANNLSDVADAAASRTNLGLQIGTNVQAYSAVLDEYAAVNPTAAGLALLDDADASAQRTTLGLAIGTDVLAFSASASQAEAEAGTEVGLRMFSPLRIAQAIAALSPGGSGDVATDTIWNAAGDLVYGTGSDTATRLAIGTEGQALVVSSGIPAWTTLPGGGDALTSGTLAQFAATTSSQLRGVISDETGSGVLVFGTSPTITTPTFSGVVTRAGGEITSASAMGALSIDTGKSHNTKSISTDSTFTFSGAPAADTWFSLLITNTDTSAHLLTFPSCFNLATGTTAAHVLVIAASAKLYLSFHYDGSAYNLHGDLGYLNKWDATVPPGVNEDLADGYGPGSQWLDVTNNKLYVCESSSLAAAVWHALN